MNFNNIFKFNVNLFCVGFLLKLFLIFIMSKGIAVDLYIPFLEVTFKDFSLDPWKKWLSNGGSPDAFPYGYVTWLIFFPIHFLFELLEISGIFSYFFTLLLIDIIIMKLLLDLFSEKELYVIILY